jgi:hypothetical protein
MPRFVTRDFETLVGDRARMRLLANNDEAFLSTGRGVVSVSRARWEEAQDAELHGWMNLWRESRDDRNLHHFALFDYFSMIRERRYERGIELGCGPFTNMRVVASTLRINTIELLDPLLQEYVEHPHCTYSDGQLRLDSGRKMPVDTFWAMPIEDLDTDKAYDVIILINVIEHCIDVDRIFDRIWSMLSRKGVFIFHDRYFDHASVERLIREDYDTAHPLKVDRGVVDAFLDRFRLVFSRHTTTRGQSTMTAGGDAVYFIGEKT